MEFESNSSNDSNLFPEFIGTGPNLDEQTEAMAQQVAESVVQANEQDDEQVTIAQLSQIDKEELPTPKTFWMRVIESCPDCGQAGYVFAEGCGHCLTCGYSSCG